MNRKLGRYGLWALFVGLLLLVGTGEVAALPHSVVKGDCHVFHWFYEYASTLGGPQEVCGELVGTESI